MPVEEASSPMEKLESEYEPAPQDAPQKKFHSMSADEAKAELDARQGTSELGYQDVPRDEPTDLAKSFHEMMEKRKKEQFDRLDGKDGRAAQKQMSRRGQDAAQSQYTRQPRAQDVPQRPLDKPMMRQPAYGPQPQQTRPAQMRPGPILQSSRPPEPMARPAIADARAQPRLGAPVQMRPARPQAVQQQMRPAQPKPAIQETRPKSGLLQKLQPSQILSMRPKEKEKAGTLVQGNVEPHEKPQFIEEVVYTCPHCAKEFKVDTSDVEGGAQGSSDPNQPRPDDSGGEEECAEKIVICPHCEKEIIFG